MAARAVVRRGGRGGLGLCRASAPWLGAVLLPCRRRRDSSAPGARTGPDQPCPGRQPSKQKRRACRSLHGCRAVSHRRCPGRRPWACLRLAADRGPCQTQRPRARLKRHACQGPVGAARRDRASSQACAPGPCTRPLPAVDHVPLQADPAESRSRRYHGPLLLPPCKGLSCSGAVAPRATRLRPRRCLTRSRPRASRALCAPAGRLPRGMSYINSRGPARAGFRSAPRPPGPTWARAGGSTRRGAPCWCSGGHVPQRPRRRSRPCHPAASVVGPRPSPRLQLTLRRPTGQGSIAAPNGPRRQRLAAARGLFAPAAPILPSRVRRSPGAATRRVWPVGPLSASPLQPRLFCVADSDGDGAYMGRTR